METHAPTLARRLRLRLVSFVMAALIGLLSALAGPGTHPTFAQGTIPTAPDWLEPRGVSIVDLVGLVPEEHLRNTTISYHVGVGMLQYVSGTRDVDNVQITARVTPRYGSDWTTIGCLGAWPVHDQWPSAVPASTVRVYSNGRDVTANIIQVGYFPSELAKPTSGATNIRYTMKYTSRMFEVPQPVRLPANMGCEILIGGGRYTDLTAVFTMVAPQRISVEVLGSQSWPAQSYIGEGESGILASLAGQMDGRYGFRHNKYTMDIPSGADFFLFKYPPTPVDPYYPEQDPVNRPLAGSGTYRLERSPNVLSVDHVSSMGLPLAGQWQDSDQAGGDFLPFVGQMTRIAVPEYFLPPGVAYHPCMTSGSCSGDILERVYNATYTVTAYYYRIQRLSNDGFVRVPLRQVGKPFAGSAAATDDGLAAPVATVAPRQDAVMIWLPIVTRPAEAAPPDDPSGCPCGVFDAQGRMFDFIAPAP